MRNEVYNAYKNTMISLLFDLGGIVPGILFYRLIVPFGKAFTWVIYLYPAILSVRGVINGIFTGRLSTGLHLGTVKIGLRNNTEYFWNLYLSMVFLCIFSSCFLGPMISLITGSNLFKVSVVTLASMILSFLAVSGITLLVAFTAFRRGYDPDYLLYPIMSTTADILVTASYFLVIWLVFNNNELILLIFPIILILLLIMYIIKTGVISIEFVSILYEVLLSVLITLFIAFSTGTVLGISNEALPSYIYVIYPAAIDTIGDVGSIVGSLATTRLALGKVKKLIDYLVDNFYELVGIKLALLTIFTGYASFPGIILTGSFSLKQLSVLLAGIVSSIIISTVSLSVAFLAYKVGLDPDDFVNPLVSTSADFITTIIMVLFAQI